MRPLIAFFALVVGALIVSVSPAEARGRGGRGGDLVRVAPHVRKGGSFVPPHARTGPNSTKLDNWSTRGNVNPYTGKQGTKALY